MAGQLRRRFDEALAHRADVLRTRTCLRTTAVHQYGRQGPADVSLRSAVSAAIAPEECPALSREYPYLLRPLWRMGTTVLRLDHYPKLGYSLALEPLVVKVGGTPWTLRSFSFLNPDLAWVPHQPGQ